MVVVPKLECRYLTDVDSSLALLLQNLGQEAAILEPKRSMVVSLNVTHYMPLVKFTCYLALKFAAEVIRTSCVQMMK